jgi:hypothetical protein
VVTEVEVNITKLSYDDFDKLIHATWPVRKDYECVSDCEWNNDEDHLYEGIDGSDYDANEFQEWLKTGKQLYTPHLLLDALVVTGVLQPGNYLIQVFW